LFLDGKEKNSPWLFHAEDDACVWNVRDCFLEFQLFALFLFCFAILSADGPWQIDHVEQSVIFFSECYYPDNEADMSGGAFF
jgi:hypothetical protein